MPTLKDYARQLERNPVWVAEDDGRVVGCLELIVAADHVVVENVAVAPSHQNRKLGSWFMAFAERDARARGLREVRTYTRASMERNVAIYQHLGYEVTARATTDGRARVFLRKRLD
jgi:ribosomal protein S18 acetylase RimI-like enzyme